MVMYVGIKLLVRLPLPLLLLPSSSSVLTVDLTPTGGRSSRWFASGGFYGTSQNGNEPEL